MRDVAKAYTLEETKVWITDPNEDRTDQENAGRELDAENTKAAAEKRIERNRRAGAAAASLYLHITWAVTTSLTKSHKVSACYGSVENTRG